MGSMGSPEAEQAGFVLGPQRGGAAVRGARGGDGRQRCWDQGTPGLGLLLYKN